MIYMTHLFENMDKAMQVDAMHTDYQKAFENVDHEMLKAKIAHDRIRRNSLRWFASYITNNGLRIFSIYSIEKL